MAEKVLFVFDAQGIGAHGESFAVGYAVYNQESNSVLKSGYFACKPEAAAGEQSDHLWVEENVAPWLPTPSQETPEQVRVEFWKVYKAVTENEDWDVSIWVDCGFPTEPSFLRDCIVEAQHFAPTMSFWADYGSKELADRPSNPKILHEIATVRYILGLDPLPTYDLPKEKRYSPEQRCLCVAPLLNSWLKEISKTSVR